MVVILDAIETGRAQIPHDMLEGAGLHGECYALAIAFYQGLGWQIFGLMKGTEVYHAVVKNPGDGTWFDARGSISEEDLGKPFGLSQPYNLKPLQEEELRELRTIQEGSIAFARRMAEEAWPELPWQESFRERARAFLEDVERLSVKYDVWIAVLNSTIPPTLVRGDGEEIGYATRPTGTGYGHTIERRWR